MAARFQYTTELSICYDRIVQYVQYAQYLPSSVAHDHIQSLCQCIIKLLHNHPTSVHDLLIDLDSTHDCLIYCIEIWTQFHKVQRHEMAISQTRQLGQVMFELLVIIDRLITVLSN